MTQVDLQLRASLDGGATQGGSGLVPELSWPHIFPLLNTNHLNLPLSDLPSLSGFLGLSQLLIHLRKNERATQAEVTVNDLVGCLKYCSRAVIIHHDQGNLQTRLLSLWFKRGKSPSCWRSMTVSGRHGGHSKRARVSNLKQETKRASQKSGKLLLSKSPSVTYVLQQDHST